MLGLVILPFRILGFALEQLTWLFATREGQRLLVTMLKLGAWVSVVSIAAVAVHMAAVDGPPWWDRSSTAERWAASLSLIAVVVVSATILGRNSRMRKVNAARLASWELSEPHHYVGRVTIVKPYGDRGAKAVIAWAGHSTAIPAWCTPGCVRNGDFVAVRATDHDIAPGSYGDPQFLHVTHETVRARVPRGAHQPSRRQIARALARARGSLSAQGAVQPQSR